MFYNQKKISKGKVGISGRNNQGKITSQRRGGGNKRRYIFVDFFRSFQKQAFHVCGFSYDSSRTAFLIVLETKLNRPTEKTRFHIVIQPKGVYLKYSINDYFNKNLDTAYIGSSYFLSAVPLGSLVYNLEARPRGGGCFVRAAGCYGQVLQKGLLVLVKLPSGNVIHFSGKCRCVIGVVSNELFLLVNNIKAGKSRWLGQRPKVRGVAINPIDHPHGGGEGKAKIGRHPVTPWGKLTKGKRTKKNKL